MRLHRFIEGAVLSIIVLVLATGVILTVQLSNQLVFEDLDPEQWLWSHYRQDRQILQFRELVSQIALGASVDDDTYTLQRDLLISRVRVSREVIERNAELLVEEVDDVVQLERLLAEYLATEERSDTTPTADNAQELLPILEAMAATSQQLLISRLELSQSSYIRATQAVSKLRIVQIGTLVTLCIAGGVLIWLTRRTLASNLALAQTRAEILERNAREVERELEIARQIQSYMFPRELPQLPGITLAAECWPAREMGGDFYDLAVLSHQQRLAIIVGDASGKSIPGAMLMAVARATVPTESLNRSTPAEVLQETNRLIIDSVPQYSFVALCCATLDMQQRRLCLANAGQLPPLRRRANGAVDYLEVSGPRFPLGITPDTRYTAHDIVLEPGDLLFFCTDGIVEVLNSDRVLFGFERLEQLIGEFGHLPPQQLIYHVRQAVSDFAGATPQQDDMTMVVLRLD